MRIAILGPLDQAIREPFAGGLERHTSQLAGGLAGLGNEVTLFARPESDPPAGVRLQACDNGYGRALLAIQAGKYDIVHNNTARRWPGLLSLLLTVPVVTTLHTPPYRGLAVVAVLSRGKRRHRYVAISDFCARQWQGLTGGSQTIHNGIQLSAWSFSPSPEQDRLVWSGRISPEKGVEYAIDAAARSGYGLDLAGPVFDRDYFSVKVAPRLNDAIRYHGHLTGDRLAQLYGSAAAGLFTSVWDEPFGLVIPEMLACGTPIAAFDSGAARELLDPEVGVVVAKYDVAALAESLAEVTCKSREKCRSYVEDRFRLEGMIASYARLYETMLGGDASGN